MDLSVVLIELPSSLLLLASAVILMVSRRHRHDWQLDL